MVSLDSAGSIGELVARFWRWWTGQLRDCVPAGIFRWTSRLRVVPLVMPEEGGFAVHRFDGAKWLRVAKAAGDTPDAMAKALGAALRRAGIERFAVGLLPGHFLARTINLPQAAEENLRNALRYELDRHTPFKPEDVGFDCCTVGRDEKNREITVKLVIAQRATIAQAVAAVSGTGLLVTAVQPGFPDRATLPINLLPHEDGRGGYLLLYLKRWLPWLLLASLGLSALALPIYQKRAQVIELLPQVNVAAQQARAADALHQQLDRTQAEYNFVLQKRYATPTSLQLLNEVTRILPDDTWLQSFELRTTSKGRELQLQGETGVAGKMIELFEQSPLLTGASFKSPVTQAPGFQASRFHLGIDVKEGAPPAPRTAAPAVEATAPAAGVATPAAPSSAVSAPAASSPPAAAPAPPPSPGAAPVAAAPAPGISKSAPVAGTGASGVKNGGASGK